MVRKNVKIWRDLNSRDNNLFKFALTFKKSIMFFVCPTTYHFTHCLGCCLAFFVSSGHLLLLKCLRGQSGPPFFKAHLLLALLPAQNWALGLDLFWGAIDNFWRISLINLILWSYFDLICLQLVTNRLTLLRWRPSSEPWFNFLCCLNFITFFLCYAIYLLWSWRISRAFLFCVRASIHLNTLDYSSIIQFSEKRLTFCI